VINHTLSHPAEELPPPFKGQTTGPPPLRKNPPVVPEKRRRSEFVRFIWAFALIALVSLVIYAIQQFRSAAIALDPEAEPTYQEQVISLEDQEKDNPRKFLKTGGTYKGTLFTGKFKIDGTIANTATVAKFKNVIIEVDYYDSKNKYLSAERFTIEDMFPPGSTKDFKLKVDPPKGADNCKWKAVGGTAY
ncbi:MAG: hypothetical protein ABIO24_02370, partial [Saprospiraceae bacterium]